MEAQLEQQRAAAVVLRTQCTAAESQIEAERQQFEATVKQQSSFEATLMEQAAQQRQQYEVAMEQVGEPVM